jgi:DNA-binding LytR/AlgR family response regulator
MDHTGPEVGALSGRVFLRARAPGARWSACVSCPDKGVETPLKPERIVARSSGRSLVFLDARDVWAFEASESLAFVHAPRGRFEIEVSLADLELALGRAFLRVHRQWLVALSKVRELQPAGREFHLLVGERGGEPEKRLSVPVARERLSAIRQELLDGAIGLRTRGNAAELNPPDLKIVDQRPR